jgi:hypothetical protein
MAPCKIKQVYAIIQRRKPFKVKDKFSRPWLTGHTDVTGVPFSEEATCQR